MDLFHWKQLVFPHFYLIFRSVEITFHENGGIEIAGSEYYFALFHILVDDFPFYFLVLRVDEDELVGLLVENGR